MTAPEVQVRGNPTPAELAALLVALAHDAVATEAAHPTTPPFPRRAGRRAHPTRWLTPAPLRREIP